MDPFALLGLPRTFDLDPAAIRRAHLAAVTRLHPDAADEEPDESAELNRAKQVLMDPERRADALLRLLGGPSKEADKTLPGGGGYLMQMMQTREEIESASTDEARQTWRTWAAELRAEYIQRVSELFSRATHSTTPDPAVLKEIRVQLNAWRYVERMVEQLDGREGDFGN